MPTVTDPTTTDPPGGTPPNQVLLRGRVTAAPEERRLPSGDLVVGVRLTVPREPSAPRTSRTTVDWFECGAWTAGLRRTVLRWQVGDVVEVQGALRRRFPRGGGISRVEVELSRARRLARG